MALQASRPFALRMAVPAVQSQRMLLLDLLQIEFRRVALYSNCSKPTAFTKFSDLSATRHLPLFLNSYNIP